MVVGFLRLRSRRNDRNVRSTSYSYFVFVLRTKYGFTTYLCRLLFEACSHEQSPLCIQPCRCSRGMSNKWAAYAGTYVYYVVGEPRTRYSNATWPDDHAADGAAVAVWIERHRALPTGWCSCFVGAAGSTIMYVRTRSVNSLMSCSVTGRTGYPNYWSFVCRIERTVGK